MIRLLYCRDAPSVSNVIFSDYKSYYYSERGIANPARLRNFFFTANQ